MVMVITLKKMPGEPGELNPMEVTGFTAESHRDDVLV